jgi:hypothetical protein
MAQGRRKTESGCSMSSQTRNKKIKHNSTLFQVDKFDEVVVQRAL